MGEPYHASTLHHEQYLKHNSETDGKPVQFYQNWSNMIKFSRLHYYSCRTVLNTLKSFKLAQQRCKTSAHALIYALPVCTCGSVAQINLVTVRVRARVCQLVVVNQQPRIKEKKTTNTKKGM